MINKNKILLRALKWTLRFASVDSLEIGGAKMSRVPVMILPTKRWPKMFGENCPKIEGVIGTQVLKQFLPMIEYPGGKLVLRSRDERSRIGLKAENKGRKVTEVPFFMALTHYMLVTCGKLNQASGLTFFVDSGIADTSAAFTVPP